jgi:hypothetical protein
MNQAVGRDAVITAPPEAPRENRMPVALLAYSVALAVFLLVPPYLKASVGPPSDFTLQELADLFTPLVVIPLAWRVFDLAGGPRRVGMGVFLVVAIVWIEGQAIHLAANAIGDALAPSDAAAYYRTAPGDLDHWLDETLGHWMWDSAWVALSFVILAVGFRSALLAPTAFGDGIAAIGGVVHGATFFLVTVEGVTTALGIPASVALLAWSGLAIRKGRGSRAVATFYFVASVLTLVAYLGWAALHGWTLPEFSKVGLFG